jgi:hypothetical protein
MTNICSLQTVDRISASRVEGVGTLVHEASGERSTAGLMRVLRSARAVSILRAAKAPCYMQAQVSLPWQ